MARICYLDSNIVEVRGGGGIWLRVFCVFIALLGAIGVGLALTDNAGDGPWTMAGMGMALAAVGIAFGGAVTRVVIDREANTVTKRWGFLWPRHEKVTQITPTAVRIIMSRDEDGAVCNKLYLMHSSGRIGLFDSLFGLASLREYAEGLAAFLGVECLVERHYRLKGAFVPQCGPGAGPTRTNLTTNTSETIDERDIVDEDIEELFEAAGADDATSLPRTVQPGRSG